MPRCLVVDHQDSFTYNLVAIVRRLIGNHNVDVDDHRNFREISDLLQYSHFILSPGPGSPDEVGCLSRRVLEISSSRPEISVLGVCLGHQLIAAHFLGPDAVARLPDGPRHGVRDQIDVIGNFGKIFANMPPSFHAVRYHSLVVDSRKFPEISDLQVTAVSRSDVQVMALAHKKFPIFGVQFHPESVLSEHGHTMIGNFLGVSFSAAVPATLPVQPPRCLAENSCDLEIARKIFFTYVYDAKIPCVWLQSAGVTILAGGRLGDVSPASAGPDRKFLVAGFRSYEGVDEFFRFGKAVSLHEGVWKFFDGHNSSGQPGAAVSLENLTDFVACPEIAENLKFRIRDSETEYKKKIGNILAGPLLSGDSYELCLTTEMEAEISNPEISVHAWLAHLEQQPVAQYSGLFANFPSGNLASFSPECFLSVRDGRVCTRPIKGTRARGQTAASDTEISEQLRTSEKDRRENLMIVDLVRNDLNKISDSRVDALFAVETLQHTLQMVSHVSAPLGENQQISDFVDALFPPGSMTGAPKIRSVEILHALEQRPRGVYSGISGFFWGERAELGVVIRSIFVDTRNFRLVLSAGGAIVHGSDVETEWREALVKFAKPLSVLQNISAQISIHNLRPNTIVSLKCPAYAQKVESLLVRKTHGNSWKIFFFGRHLARMRDAGFPLDDAEIRKFLCNFLASQDASAGIEHVDEQIESEIPTEDFKLRILWSEISSPQISMEELRPLPARGSVCLSSVVVFSFDALLRRKFPITRPDCEIMTNERGEVTEGNWFNVAFSRAGCWVTPEISCGLLPGVYRKFLLERGVLREGVVPLASLVPGEEIMCFNSVRGVWKASLVL